MTSTVKGSRAINAAASGSINAAQLQTYLGDAGNLASFQQIAQMPAAMTAMAASSTAMTVIAGSAAALAALYVARPAIDAITASAPAMAALSATGSSAITDLFAQPYGALRAANTSASLTAITASANAMGQVANSTPAMAAMTSSVVGMSALIGSQTAITAIGAVPAALATFKASTALAAVATPAMASYSASFPLAVPGGTYTVTKSNDDDGTGGISNYAAHNLFDKQNDANNNTVWKTTVGNSANQWVALQFPAPVFVYTAKLDSRAVSGGQPTQAKDWRLEYSDDGSTWTIASPVVTLGSANASTISVDTNKAGKHAYWRVYVLNNYGGTTIDAGELTLSGFA